MLLRQFLEINLASSNSLLRVLCRAFIHYLFFTFFEQEDPVFTAIFSFPKHCYQLVNPSHFEKDHYLFINYELFIIHYLLLNLQKQAEGHTTIGLCACDLFLKAGKKEMNFTLTFFSSISDKQKRPFLLSGSLYYPCSS